MSTLSPAAQAVLDAVDEAIREWPPSWEAALAAAIRTVAMEVVLPKYQFADWEMADLIMTEIQAIADELEDAQ
jgi:hypothetical protein